VFFYFI